MALAIVGIVVLVLAAVIAKHVVNNKHRHAHRSQSTAQLPAPTEVGRGLAEMTARERDQALQGPDLTSKEVMEGWERYHGEQEKDRP